MHKAQFRVIDRYRLIAVLLPLLEKEGILLGPDRYVRLQRLFETLPDGAFVSDLADYLCPVFAVNVQQQIWFRTTFEQLVSELPQLEFMLSISPSIPKSGGRAKPVKSDIKPEQENDEKLEFTYIQPSDSTPTFNLELDNCTKPPYLWKIAPDENIPLETENDFGQKINKLRSRELSETVILDIPGTVQETVRQAGMPALRYRQRTRPAEYLLLVERFSADDHRALLFDRLRRILRDQEVLIECFFHDGDLRTCYNEQFPAGISLQNLRHRHASARLLVVGSGYRLLNTNSGKLNNWTSQLTAWYSRALLTPVSRHDWGIREYRLADIFTLLPAAWEAFQFAAEYLPTGAKHRYAELPAYVRVAAEMPPITLKKPVPDALCQHFDPDVCAWIAACAVWPSLHFDLTLRLGRLLSSPKRPLLNFGNLARIANLPWFANGFIPKEDRHALVAYLQANQPEVLKRVVAYLIQLLEENPPTETDSLAFAEHQINIAILKLYTSESPDPKAVEKLQTVVKRLNRDVELTDFVLPATVEKIVEKLVGKTSPGSPPKLTLHTDVSGLPQANRSPGHAEGVRALPSSQIIKTASIETYLSVGNHDDKFFLIGSKGTGKTTLLRYKSWLYHEQFGNAYKSNTSTDELTERLEINVKTFSKEDLFSFRHFTDWVTLWKLTLWTLSFKIYGLEINPQLDEMIQKSSRLSTIFSKLLANRKKIAAFPQYINEFIENAQKIKSGVAIFIDDVDQAFEQCFLSNEHYHRGDNLEIALNIWINSQNALMAAIYAIRRQNHHIKIFATIRSEAFNAFDNTMKTSYLAHATLLEYDKADIRDIFIKNIQLIPDEQLAFPTGATPIEQFLGFDDEMNHRFAVDYSNEPRKETAFDFIFRHTYGRPREIVHMGKQLHGLVTQESYHKLSRGEKIEKVRTMATQFADKLFADYRKQIIPNFDYDVKFMQFIKAVPGNVIPTEELGRLDTQTTRLYYSLGLLGHVEEYPFGKKIQRFLPAAEYNYTNLLDIPKSEFYIIHPTIDQVLLKYHTYGDFYYKYCIIGNGYPFHSPQGDMPKQKEHYIPKKLSGYDGKVPADGHAYGIREYYNHFFGSELILKFNWAYVNEIKLAKLVLTKLARICYFHRLNKAFAGEQYADKIRAFTQELEDFSITRPYYNIMNEEEMDASQSKFLDKLFGRTIALGAILFLDLRFASIKKLLLTGQIELKCEDDRDTVYQFFRRSFFIPNLSRKDQSLSNDFKLPEHRKAKQDIFDTLSAFEQDSLIELRKIVIQEVEMTSATDLFIEPAHADWVIQNVMNRIWNPLQ